ncbi:unnamed protein product [Pleuronectes platessa]|uniref:Uncharacterized protein n=1 Tax=Pleuronectes platessa TaxID=8262 RepID=A0A9N7V2U4_PLEPL|nr:unnamed protein product [Pleuronectes platessa]
MPHPGLWCFLMEELSRREPVIPRSRDIEGQSQPMDHKDFLFSPNSVTFTSPEVAVNLDPSLLPSRSADNAGLMDSERSNRHIRSDESPANRRINQVPDILLPTHVGDCLNVGRRTDPQTQGFDVRSHDLSVSFEYGL